MGDETLDQRPVCHCTVICELPLYTYGGQHIPWSSATIPTQLLACGLLLSPASFSSPRSLQPPTPFPHSSSLLSPPPCNPLLPLALVSLSPSLPSPSQSTARGWASATSMKTDDSVLLFFFSAPLPQTPLQERSVCLGGEGEMRRID